MNICLQYIVSHDCKAQMKRENQGFILPDLKKPPEMTTPPLRATISNAYTQNITLVDNARLLSGPP